MMVPTRKACASNDGGFVMPDSSARRFPISGSMNCSCPSPAKASIPGVGAGVLTCGGQPAAYEIAFHYRHHHYLYIIAQDPRFVSQSPSKVQVDEAQAWDIANGVEVFDLLPPADRYKLDLSDQTVAIFDYLKPLSFIGMLYVAYLVRARPALKALYLKYVAPIAGGLFGRRHR